VETPTEKTKHFQYKNMVVLTVELLAAKNNQYNANHNEGIKFFEL
jgi:hypothetical protein